MEGAILDHQVPQDLLGHLDPPGMMDRQEIKDHLDNLDIKDHLDQSIKNLTVCLLPKLPKNYVLILEMMNKDMFLVYPRMEMMNMDMLLVYPRMIHTMVENPF